MREEQHVVLVLIIVDLFQRNKMPPAGGIEDREVQPETNLQLDIHREDEEKSINGGDSVISYHRASIASVSEDCIGEHGSPAAAAVPQSLSTVHDQGLRFNRSDQEIFEVSFPPTGPLGITFEWAVDPMAWAMVTNGDTLNSGGLATAGLRPQCKTSGKTLPRTPRTISQRPRSADLMSTRDKLRSIRPPADFFGDSNPTTPRKVFPPVTLPPLATSPQVDLTGSFVPHALRIQNLSLSSMGIPRSNVRLRTTQNYTEVKSVAAGGLVEATRTNEQQESIEEKQSVDRSTTTSISRERVYKTPGTTSIPSTGHGVLCVGDVLIEVNGKPVAGPAARIAGISSFQDAVDTVATVLEGRGVAEGERVHRGQRILKFWRAARSTPPSSWAPTSIVQPPGKNEYVRDLSGRDASTGEDQGKASSAGSEDSAESSDKPSGSSTSPELLAEHMSQSNESKARKISILSSRSKVSLGTSVGGSSNGSDKAGGKKKRKSREGAESPRASFTGLSKTKQVKARARYRSLDHSLAMTG